MCARVPASSPTLVSILFRETWVSVVTQSFSSSVTLGKLHSNIHTFAIFCMLATVLSTDTSCFIKLYLHKKLEPGLTWVGAVSILLDGPELCKGWGEKGALDPRMVKEEGFSQELLHLCFQVSASPLQKASISSSPWCSALTVPWVPSVVLVNFNWKCLMGMKWALITLPDTLLFSLSSLPRVFQTKRIWF